MKYGYPYILEESKTPRAKFSHAGFVSLAPLVMLVWLVYWAGMFSHTCCQFELPDVHHHSSHVEASDEYHVVDVGTHEHDTPSEHGNCTELTSTDNVPAATVAVMGSIAQPVLIVSHNIIVPEQYFSVFSSYSLSQRPPPPQNRFLRNRRLLI